VQYRTFLSLPFSTSMQEAFVAMVVDVASNKDGAGVKVEHGSPPPQQQLQQQQAGKPGGLQPLLSGLHSPCKQPLQSPGVRLESPLKPRPQQQAAAAAAAAAAAGGGRGSSQAASQVTSQQDGDEEGDEGDDEDEEDGDEEGGDEEGRAKKRQAREERRAAGGGGSGATTPSRPQRMRRPKQYLGEGPDSTPPRSRRGGSLPTTPASQSRGRQVGWGGMEGAEGNRRAVG
jgi:hypothetical protein